MVSDRSLKFLCSYGGKIVLRQADGKLRYQGGHTRVLSVDPSVSYAELMVKLGEFCGYSVELRCQLPGGDLETLISVKSDEELKSVIEEYKSFPDLKIRAVLSPPKSLKTVSPPTSKASSIDYLYSSPKSPFYDAPCYMNYSPPVGFPVGIYRDHYGNVTGNGRLKERFCYDSRCYKNWH